VKGSSWFESLPENIEAREKEILDAVSSGQADLLWTPVSVSEDLTVFTTADALRIGEPGDSVRVSMTCLTQQRVADMLSAYLPTAKLVDDIWVRSTVRLGPFPQPINSTKAGMLKHHEELEGARAGRMGLISGWKDWTVGKRLIKNSKAAQNYGWHIDTTKDSWKGIRLHNGATVGKVIQPASLAHDVHHVDYSQLCRLVMRKGIYQGRLVDLSELITQPAHAGSLSSEGAISTGMRHPGIEQVAPDDTEEYPIEIQGPSSGKPQQTTLGDKGPAVKEWQEYLIHMGYGSALEPWGADGDHGPATERATNQLNASPEGEVAEASSSTLIARNYTPANRDEVKWVMIHTMEAPEKENTSEAVASWFAGPNAPRTSAHYCVDSDSIVTCVLEQHVAWACPGANRYGVHYELAGYAKQDSEDWSDSFSESMLKIVARYAAETAKRWDIPIIKIGPTDMRAGRRGFCGHVDGSKAFKKSTHYDPGPHFPWDKFIELVKSYSKLLA